MVAILLVACVILVFVIKTRLVKSRLKSDTDESRPGTEKLPVAPVQNDKLVIVDGVGEDDLKRVIVGFCNMYNKEMYQALPRLTGLADTSFALTFPYDIDFEIYCYFINYLAYPMELKWSPKITAWTTTKTGDHWISERSANKRVMLFIPGDDREHDNVYLTTVNDTGYKLGFAVGEEHQLLATPSKRFSEPSIDLQSLTGKHATDFK